MTDILDPGHGCQGLLVFGEVPSAATLAGAALITGGALVVVRTPRVLDAKG